MYFRLFILWSWQYFLDCMCTKYRFEPTAPVRTVRTAVSAIKQNGNGQKVPAADWQKEIKHKLGCHGCVLYTVKRKYVSDVVWKVYD